MWENKYQTNFEMTCIYYAVLANIYWSHNKKSKIQLISKNSVRITADTNLWVALQ
jgi:hypothetical protein